jgi:hypothetical protein
MPAKLPPARTGGKADALLTTMIAGELTSLIIAPFARGRDPATSR